MEQTSLDELLFGKDGMGALLEGILHISGVSVAILDEEGDVLLGVPDLALGESAEKHPILCEGKKIGLVAGEHAAGPIAALLNRLLDYEFEKEELIDEVLSTYRQINLLYNLAENLGASLELEKVAKATLEQATRLIEATGAVFLWRSGESVRFEFIASWGIPLEDIEKQTHNKEIMIKVASMGMAEIVNDAQSDPRFHVNESSIQSLIYAPIKAKGKATGSISLFTEHPITYTAADLNLLTTITSQAAPAIDNAILYEKTLREAQEREQRLQRQIRELRIELDEARQEEKLAEITETEYFQRLRDQADHLRGIIGIEE
ncbi:MAG: GAF domain-containing protein [Anaerolineales bacterium]|nr:GAF domain-containing protein [Anaerolineales bacterium]